MIKHQYQCVSRQRGSVLTISLIFLLLLTIIGATTMQSTTIQERMAGNMRDVNIALQGAESGLRAGETVLQGATVGPFNGTYGNYTPAASDGTPRWEDGTTSWQTVTETLPYVSVQPQYIIEDLAPLPDPKGSLAADAPVSEIHFYRVTARAGGLNNSTEVILQTNYRR